MKSIIAVSILTLSLISCSHPETEKRVTQDGLAQEGFEGSHYTAVQFEKGRAELSESNKRFIHKLKRRASETGREIEEIKILAWADREYPQKSGEEPRTRDVILANERASAIRDFIREELRSREPIDVFNMAKKPNLLERLTRDEEYFVKRDVAMSGVSGTRLPTGEISYTKAGKVLVIIDYKEENR